MLPKGMAAPLRPAANFMLVLAACAVSTSHTQCAAVRTWRGLTMTPVHQLLPALAEPEADGESAVSIPVPQEVFVSQLLALSKVQRDNTMHEFLNMPQVERCCTTVMLGNVKYSAGQHCTCTAAGAPTAV